MDSPSESELAEVRANGEERLHAHSELRANKRLEQTERKVFTVLFLKFFAARLPVLGVASGPTPEETDSPRQFLTFRSSRCRKGENSPAPSV